jgi:hypothetical protein
MSDGAGLPERAKIESDYQAWTQSAGLYRFALDLVTEQGDHEEAAKLRPIARLIVAEWEACAEVAGIPMQKRMDDLEAAAVDAGRNLAGGKIEWASALQACAAAVGVTLVSTH